MFPPRSAEFDLHLNFLRISRFSKLLLDCTSELADGIVFVLNDILLPGKEEVAFQNIQKETQMR